MNGSEFHAFLVVARGALGLLLLMVPLSGSFQSFLFLMRLSPASASGSQQHWRLPLAPRFCAPEDAQVLTPFALYLSVKVNVWDLVPGIGSSSLTSSSSPVFFLFT